MKNLSSKKLLFAAAGAALVVTSCNQSPYEGYELSDNGVYAKFYNHNEEGVKPVEGDVVRLTMSYSNSKDSVLFDTKVMKPNGNDYIEFPLGKPTFKGSFEEAITMMAVGDSASFKISADSVYLKTFMAQEIPAYIEKGSMLTFEAKLTKISSKDEVEAERAKKMEEQRVMMELRKNEEPKVLAKYLEDNKINAKPTASGLIFVESTKGKGPKPTKGSIVKVNYTGRLLDGKVFDTSDETIAKEAGVFDSRRPYQPIEFPLGMGQVIPGWEEGIALMSAGSKGKLILPSSVGYGAQGGGPIPPYSTLVFDVELVSFEKAKE